ncbi:hypothetical protein ACEQ6C_38435, partial [Rhizobium ruizarguesonis]
MKTNRLTVELGERSYEIVIGDSLLQQVPDLLAEAGVVSTSKLMISSWTCEPFKPAASKPM